MGRMRMFGVIPISWQAMQESPRSLLTPSIQLATDFGRLTKCLLLKFRPLVEAGIQTLMFLYSLFAFDILYVKIKSYESFLHQAA
jgi:hypothetical protein